MSHIPSNLIVNYDTPWADICAVAQGEAALDSCGAHCCKTVRRENYSEEFWSGFMGGVSLCILDGDKASPFLDNDSGHESQRARDLKMQAMCSLHWEYYELLPDRWWSIVAAEEGSVMFPSFIEANEPLAPAVRKGGLFGSDTKPQFPMAHRLEGELVNCAAIILVNDSVDLVDRWIPEACPHPDDRRALHFAHEFGHCLQLEREEKTFADILQRERDAEQFSTSVFQTVFGGSPVVAARYILGNVVSAVLFSSPDHIFMPGLTDGENVAMSGTASRLLIKGVAAEAGWGGLDEDLLSRWGHWNEEVAVREAVCKGYEEDCPESVDTVDGDVLVLDAMLKDAMDDDALIGLRGIFRAVSYQELSLSHDEYSLGEKFMEAVAILSPRVFEKTMEVTGWRPAEVSLRPVSVATPKRKTRGNALASGSSVLSLAR